MLHTNLPPLSLENGPMNMKNKRIHTLSVRMRKAATFAVCLIVSCTLFLTPVLSGISSAQGLQPSNETTTQASDTAATAYAELDEDEYAANEVLVMVDDMQDAQELSEQLASVDGVSEVALDASDVEAGFAVVKLDDGASSGQVADMLCAQGVDAQPNFVYYALEGEEGDRSDEDSALIAQSSGTNDPQAGKQWMLGSVSAPIAWDLQKTNKSVSVAIIDSGCNVNHEDLKNNVVGTFDTKTGGTDVTDEQDHGTHVAGIIAAEANNGTGIAGVSYNAGLYIVRALHKSSGEFVAESSDVIKAIDNVMANKSRHNIRVINMSLGSRRSGSLSGNDQAVMDKLNEASTKHGILTVTAAGNNDGNGLPYHCYPADFSTNVIGVIGLQQSGNTVARYSESNYNVSGERSKGLSAPGAEVFSTVTSGYYSYKTGTSMAAPCVSGIAALVFAARPSLSASEARSVLCSSATDLGSPGFDAYTGYGEVNAYAAVSMAKNGSYLSGPDSVTEGSTITLSSSVSAYNWTSDDTSVATVNSNGTVTGVRTGYVTISAWHGNTQMKKTVQVTEAPPAPVTTTPMYRLYNPYSGEHLFTRDANEYATLPAHGWRQEGVAWTSPAEGEPVYRLYNPYSGDHHYTMDANEYASLPGYGWRQEGVAFHSDPAQGRAIYRLFNPHASTGTHHYTLDANEYATLPSYGWRQEGVAWYGM